MEGIARQPEAGGRIGTNMIIAAALIEGFTFFALVIVLLLWLRINQF
jgi:F-type H+-transporting ATPase subunit c